MRIIETEVWCSESEENAKMGLPDGDMWMPIAFDWDSVVAIKLAGENDFLGNDKATIYLGPIGQTIIINMPYEMAVKVWKGANTPSK